MEGRLAAPKCVLIGAPHTSNWDFPIGMLLFWSLDIDARWVAKHTIFKWPIRGLLRALGGIPLDRTKTENFVAEMVERFTASERLVFALAPEGTRKHTDYWRSGFYWIAHGAGVPIALAYADYARKVAGIGPSFMPSGDIDSDMAKIRTFYADKVGRHPEKLGSIRLRSEAERSGASSAVPNA